MCSWISCDEELNVCVNVSLHPLTAPYLYLGDHRHCSRLSFRHHAMGTKEIVVRALSTSFSYTCGFA